MRTEQTLDLTSSGASLTGDVAGDTRSIPSFSTQPLPVASQLDVEWPLRGEHRGLVDGDDWKVDEHWTAVTAYLADLYLPNEG